MRNAGDKRAGTVWPVFPQIAGMLCAALLLTLFVTLLPSCGDEDLAVGGAIIVPTLPPGDPTPTP